MAAWAVDVEGVRATLARELAAVDLRLLEVDEARPVGASEAADLDDRLAENLLNVETGRQTVWGSIHCYAGDGEA